MAITYFGKAHAPSTENTEASGATQAVTPPANMVVGDLVLLWANYRGSVTLTISEAGGQAWNTGTNRQQGSTCTARTFWCRYNGTWDADPSVTNTTGTAALSVTMLVFRPTYSDNDWGIDNLESITGYAAPSTPFDVTITGVTPSQDNALIIARWASADDNVWVRQTAGWTDPESVHSWRNNGTGSDDNSVAFSYLIQTTKGATGNVTSRQSTLGGDLGVHSIVSFNELTRVLLTGQSLALAQGSLDFTIGAVIPVTGQALALAQGTVTVETATNANVPIVGQALALAQGSVNVIVNHTEVLIGQSLSLTQGDVSIFVGIIQEITGQALVLAQGTINAVSDYTEILTGQSLTLNQGSVSVVVDDIAILVGQELLLDQGVLDIITDGNVTVGIAGQELSLEQGNVETLFDYIEPIAGQSLVLAQGVVDIILDQAVDIIGQELSLSQGSVDVVFNQDVLIVGQELGLAQGSLVVSSLITIQITGQSITLRSGKVTAMGFVVDTFSATTYEGENISGTVYSLEVVNSTSYSIE